MREQGAYRAWILYTPYFLLHRNPSGDARRAHNENGR